MRAFSQFVHRMDSDLQAIEHADHENTAQREEICAKYMNDWNAFIQFADQFNTKHHRKEEVLYNEAEKQIADEKHEHADHNSTNHRAAQKEEICAKYLNDWNAFIQFADEYNTKHHRKEEVLYNEAEKQIADEKHVHYAMIRNVNDEHYYEHKLYQLIAQRLKIDDEGNEEQFAQNIENIVSSAKLLTDLLFKHIVLENDVVYPRITKQLLNTRQMEHISQELDEYDRENREVVKEMEFLSQAEHKLYQLIAQRLKIDDEGNEEQFAQNIDNIVSSAKLLTDLLFKHIVLENDVVYPRITKQLLNTRQMEQISQELDEYDRENSEVVQAMEFLSHGLVRKFNGRVAPPA
eukprot:CAMPEP_0197072868 /NCGR_PEP_ID=MMETSP1384-20130603/210314_1 /TAXON_ID=29189 /ORGANISM="Ammonia sp." /LENGTH=348 /DNA_ID=CAMNT_0042511689 /DNA_START=253 /DNA_END=1300 /DNA_ORIENTATION=-